jgi:hypothetical protein
MSSTFQLKIDPSTLPKLTSKGDNYAEWRSAWQIAFKYAKLWNVVEGMKPHPTAGVDKQEVWDDADTKAMVMLLLLVHSDLTFTITGAETASRA